MITRFAFFVIILVAFASSVSAGVLTSSVSDAGTDGMRMDLSWSQGCPAQSLVIEGVTVNLPASGPHTCSTVQKPYYCSFASDGSSAYVRSCVECGCGLLSECVPSTGQCQACVNPCDIPNTCPPAHTCQSYPPSTENSCDYSVQCIPERRDIRVNAELVRGFCTWNIYENEGDVIGNVRVSNSTHEYPRSRTYTWAANGWCGAKEITIRVKWYAGSSTPVCEKTYDPDGSFSITYCRFDGYNVHARCQWNLGGSSTNQFTGPLPYDGSVISLDVNCLSAIGYTHGARYDFRRPSTGGFQCRKVPGSEWGTAGTVTVRKYTSSGTVCGSTWV